MNSNKPPRLWWRVLIAIAIWAVAALGVPRVFPDINWNPAGADTLLAAILVGVTWFYAAETSRMRSAAALQLEVAESEHQLRQPALVANIAFGGGWLALEIVNVGGTAALDVCIEVQFLNVGTPGANTQTQKSPSVGALLPNERIRFGHPAGGGVSVSVTGKPAYPLGRVVYSGKYRTTNGATAPVVPTEIDVATYMDQMRLAKMTIVP